MNCNCCTVRPVEFGICVVEIASLACQPHDFTFSTIPPFTLPDRASVIVHARALKRPLVPNSSRGFGSLAVASRLGGQHAAASVLAAGGPAARRLGCLPFAVGAAECNQPQVPCRLAPSARRSGVSSAALLGSTQAAVCQSAAASACDSSFARNTQRVTTPRTREVQTHAHAAYVLVVQAAADVESQSMATRLGRSICRAAVEAGCYFDSQSAAHLMRTPRTRSTIPPRCTPHLLAMAACHALLSGRPPSRAPPCVHSLRVKCPRCVPPI